MCTHLMWHTARHVGHLGTRCSARQQQTRQAEWPQERVRGSHSRDRHTGHSRSSRLTTAEDEEEGGGVSTTAGGS